MKSVKYPFNMHLGIQIRPSRRDILNHIVGNPTNSRVERLDEKSLLDYYDELESQIKHCGTLSPERAEALNISLGRAEEELSKRGLISKER